MSERFMGEFDPKVTYKKGDVVTLNGEAYRRVRDDGGKVNPFQTMPYRVWQKKSAVSGGLVNLLGPGGGSSGGGSDNLVVTVNTHFDNEEGTRITTYDADWDVIKQRFIEGKPTFVRWSNNYTTNSRQDIEFENVAPLSQVEFEDNSYATKGLVAFSINNSCNMRYVKLYSDGTALCSSLLLQRVQLPT